MFADPPGFSEKSGVGSQHHLPGLVHGRLQHWSLQPLSPLLLGCASSGVCWVVHPPPAFPAWPESQPCVTVWSPVMTADENSISDGEETAGFWRNGTSDSCRGVMRSCCRPGPRLPESRSSSSQNGILLLPWLPSRQPSSARPAACWGSRGSGENRKKHYPAAYEQLWVLNYITHILSLR